MFCKVAQGYLLLQGRSTLTNGVTPNQHVHTILRTQFHKIPPKNYRRPLYRLESGAPDSIWSIAGGVKGREAPERWLGRDHREGAPIKRGQGCGPGFGQAAEGGRSAIASVWRLWRVGPLLADPGYLATRRHPSQQPLHLTYEVGDYETQHAPRPRRLDYKSHKAPPTLS